MLRNPNPRILIVKLRIFHQSAFGQARENAGSSSGGFGLEASCSVRDTRRMPVLE
jgi:hypothetical protein